MTAVRSLVALLGTATLAATLSFEATAQGACDRSCLRGFVDDYFTALTARDFARLPVAEGVKYTENGRVLTLGEGFWKTAGNPLAYRDYLLDAESGGAAALTAFEEPAERHPRAELVAAADAYFTAVQTEGTPQFVQAPFDPALKRFENGQQTTNVTEKPVLERHTWTPILQLERASYAGTIVTDRRYAIVDTELGSVLAVATFRREGEHTSTLLLAEAFKYTGGRLREIRAVILNLPNGAGTGWTAPR